VTLIGLANEFVAKAVFADSLFQHGAILRRRIAPITLDRRVLRPHRILVDVAVLDDQSRDSLWGAHGQPQADPRAIVVQIECVTRQPQLVCELLQERRVCPEPVVEVLEIRRIAITEAGIIRRNQMPAVGQRRQQAAVLERRAGISMR
jgi:hypothetical protein